MTKKFIVTGIGRSGTSIISLCLNHIQNCYCLNECPGLYDIPSLETVFNELAIQIKQHHTCKNRYVRGTDILATDTTKQETEIKVKPINYNPSFPIAIGSKITFPYLNDIIRVSPLIFVIFVVRNPVYTIQSWLNILDRNPEHIIGKLLNGNISDIHWKIAANRLKKHRNDLLTRMCILWDSYNELIIKNHNKGIVIRYEEFCHSYKNILNLLKHKLQLRNNPIHRIPITIKDYNIDERQDLNKIKLYVDKYCNSKQYWGY